MRVIVKIQEGKFHDGRRSIRPELGDVIDLPDQIARKEIEAGYALPYEEDAKPKSSKKKKAQPATESKKKKETEKKSKGEGVKKNKIPAKKKEESTKTKKKKKRTPVF